MTEGVNQQRPNPQIAGQLVFLGTGTSTGVPMLGCDCPVCRSDNPRNRRLRCGLLLGLPQGNLLVDTPPDLRTQLLRERVGFAHAVVYTHEHADHIYGLDDMRLFPFYIGHPVPLYCEPAVERRIRNAFDYAFDPIPRSTHAGAVPKLTFHTIGDGPFPLLGITVTPIPLEHGSFRVLGFRFGNVAYCTDTNHIPETSWPLLEGLDTVVLPALRPKPHATHFGLDQALDAARRIGARRTFFTHISHELEHDATNARLPSGIELAYDGLRIPLV
ncbi:MAG TPA: MBL fold metallo-hydrolase [Pirellulales bacterium]|jgi:phosphoribosyl 1,2-cyclic phosphate phosphodiesterase|nr:MBL fold metallo-hydrolase [Pirellulales bacterium]